MTAGLMTVGKSTQQLLCSTPFRSLRYGCCSRDRYDRGYSGGGGGYERGYGSGYGSTRGYGGGGYERGHRDIGGYGGYEGYDRSGYSRLGYHANT